MLEKSRLKLDMFNKLLDFETMLKEKYPDNEYNAKELVKLFNNQVTENKEGSLLNTTDHLRLKHFKSFKERAQESKKFAKYFKLFTLTEIEYLGIYEKKTSEEKLIEVADIYVKYLQENDYNNSSSFIKGLMRQNNEIKLSRNTVDKISKLNDLSRDEKNIQEIRELVAELCTDLKINSEFISFCKNKRSK